MPKGQYPRTRRANDDTLFHSGDHFTVKAVFKSRNTNKKVWKYLEKQIKRDFLGYEEVADALKRMSDSELDMLDYKNNNVV